MNVQIGESAEIHGDISCHFLEMSSGCSVLGSLNVSLISSSVCHPESECLSQRSISLTNLLLLDPQCDFLENGTNPVLCASETLESYCEIIEEYGERIDSIIVSLCVFQRMQIFHSVFWKSGNEYSSVSPVPYTTISSNDVLIGKWIPRVGTLKVFLQTVHV